MLFYFLITYCSLVVTFNTSYIAASAHLDATRSGFIISLFFLAIMAPGFVLNAVIRWLGNAVNLWSLIVMGAGLLLMSLPHPSFSKLATGANLAGLGYGVMQPIVYDKAATNSPPSEATLALSLVMAVNYLAIVVAPFLIEATNRVFHTSSYRFAFLCNGLITLIIAIVALFTMKKSRVLGNDD